MVIIYTGMVYAKIFCRGDGVVFRGDGIPPHPPSTRALIVAQYDNPTRRKSYILSWGYVAVETGSVGN